MRANEFLFEHKKGVLAKKYNSKPRPAINPSVEFAKQKAKVNTPVSVSEDGVLDTITNTYKKYAPTWAGGTPNPVPATPKPPPVPVPAKPAIATDVAATSFKPADHVELLKLTAIQSGITDKKDLANLLGQAASETNQWQKSVENMNYQTPQRIYNVFTHLFKKGLTPQQVKADPTVLSYVGNPVKLANDAYAGKNGNGNAASGDGWKYRGRGFLQCTGKANYATFGAEAHPKNPTIYLNNPDILCTNPAESAVASVSHFLKSVGLNASQARANKGTSGHSNINVKGRAANTKAELKKLQGKK